MEGTEVAVKRCCGILSQWVHIAIHLSKPIKCTPASVNPNVNYSWVIMMCHCGFINFNKCAIVPGDAVEWGGCAGLRSGGIWIIPDVGSIFL